MPSLDQNFALASPRLTPPPRFLAGPLIWTLAVGLFVALFAQGFVRMGVGAWAVGLVYILYDTVLVMFVLAKTRPLSKPLPEREGQGVGVAAGDQFQRPSLYSALPTPTPFPPPPAQVSPLPPSPAPASDTRTPGTN